MGEFLLGMWFPISHFCSVDGTRLMCMLTELSRLGALNEHKLGRKCGRRYGKMWEIEVGGGLDQNTLHNGMKFSNNKS